ncbi:hypothetical protein HK414_09905 [Ramlibacter terrae]|uniref:Uncharacterized protein n=1 Tax=Ramlibacter terrae TaxID=2732511 RepID=A0ABX6P2Z9_9BURK|nr:hypothetical protein HK414_09905 [Ramlibacter terrae]
MRPTFMTQRHYRAQVAWAAARAQGTEAPPLPPFMLRAALALPARLLRDAAARTRRRLRAAIRGT